MAAIPGAHLVIGAGPLARELPERGAGITVLANHYPMLDALPAFDAAIAAAGYNTVHELLFAGIPAVLVPFERVLDDQEARVQSLVQTGACLACAPLTATGLTQAVQQLADADTRKRLAKRAKEVVKTNGANAAAKAILELA